MKPSLQLLTVQKAATQLRVSARTLKYYEEHGLVTPGRSKGRYRLYDAADLGRCARILRLRSLGFSLQTIAEMLKRPFDHTLTTGRARYSESSLRETYGELQKQLELLCFDLAFVNARLAGGDLAELLAARGKLTFAHPAPPTGTLVDGDKTVPSGGKRRRGPRQ
jgi:DNA-binding transcriptional MerR regulator